MKQNGTRRNEQYRKSKLGAVGHYEILNDGVAFISSTSRSDVTSIARAKCGLLNG